MARSMAKELKALQQENAWLKKLVANQDLDIEILREAAKRNLRWARFVVVWGQIEFRSAELVEILIRI